jgi:hypothetical protein
MVLREFRLAWRHPAPEALPAPDRTPSFHSLTAALLKNCDVCDREPWFVIGWRLQLCGDCYAEQYWELRYGRRFARQAANLAVQPSDPPLSTSVQGELWGGDLS